MARFQLSQERVDAAVRTQEISLVLVVLGWIMLGMSALVGIFVFPAFRDGDSMWPTYTGVMGLIGLVLLVAGWWARRSTD